jgi:hypothetical protein
MSDLIIKSDNEPTVKRHKPRATPSNRGSVSLLGADGTVVCRAQDAPRPASLKPITNTGSGESGRGGGGRGSDQGEIKVIEILDPKSIKLNIVKNWQAYADCPSKIVKTMRRLYQNTATASSQLSNLKSVLSLLTPAPPEAFLSALKLSRKEYHTLHTEYREKRDKEGKDLRTINDSDKLVQSALEMITSSDFRVLWPAALVCSGLRPIEILTCRIKELPDAKHVNPEFWVCISNWAKKGDPRAGRDFCVDHPLLCPSSSCEAHSSLFL